MSVSLLCHTLLTYTHISISWLCYYMENLAFFPFPSLWISLLIRYRFNYIIFSLTTYFIYLFSLLYILFINFLYLINVSIYLFLPFAYIKHDRQTDRQTEGKLNSYALLLLYSLFAYILKSTHRKLFGVKQLFFWLIFFSLNFAKCSYTK